MHIHLSSLIQLASILRLSSRVAGPTGYLVSIDIATQLHTGNPRCRTSRNMSEIPSPSLSSHRPSLASRGHSAPGAVQVRSLSVSAAQTSPPDSSTRYSRSRANSTRSPPSYARSYLDRSPSASAFRPDDRPRVPPPIYLRSSSSQGSSKQGQLKIHIPAWYVASW